MSEKLVQHLQMTFAPSEYQVIAACRSQRDASSVQYWESLPTYLIARCPICNAPYIEKLDTYSLHGWTVYPDFWNFVYVDTEVVRQFESKERLQRLVREGKMPVQQLRNLFPLESSGLTSAPQRIDCAHFVAVQHFIHLNGFMPKELRYFSNESEVPYVMPIFLPDDVESYAVMHSLPICRVEQGQFVPRYTVYMLTYYSDRPAQLRERSKARCKEADADSWGHCPMLYTWRVVQNMPEAWDLEMWRSKGKLLWLNLDKPDLPLKAGPMEDFPYAHIDGIRKGHTYRKKKLVLAPW